jgi:hypothetical protein
MAEQPRGLPAIAAVRADGRRALSSVTVIRVRRWTELVAGIRLWRRIQREMRTLAHPPLMVRGWVSLRTRELTFVSMWPDLRSLLFFNSLASHVEAVRWVIRGKHDSWTGIFNAVGPAELSRVDDEPHWLEVLDARASAQPDPAQPDPPRPDPAQPDRAESR